MTVMPGPQMVAAIAACRDIRSHCPKLPIVWGGYFPSIYSDAALNARYVDYVVRGQGEETLLELIDALRGKRPLEGILGLSYKDMFGLHRHNPERLMKGPGCSFPGRHSIAYPLRNTCALLSSANEQPRITPALAAPFTAASAAFTPLMAHASCWKAQRGRKPSFGI